MKKTKLITMLLVFGMGIGYAHPKKADTALSAVTATDPIIPVFDTVAIVFDGTSGLPSYTQLPGLSSNGIRGWWDSGSLSSDGIMTFTFTPYLNQNAVKTTLSTFNSSNPNVLVVQDDEYRGFYTGGSTPPVFNNDVINSIPAADRRVMLINPPSGFSINNYGNIIVPVGLPHSATVVQYKVYQFSCPDNFAIGKVTFNAPLQHERKNMQETDNLPDFITVAPNPSTGLYNVDLSSAHKIYDTVKVFSLLGELVYEGTILNPQDSNVVDLSHLSAGCYIACVSGAGGSSSFRLIKK